MIFMPKMRLLLLIVLITTIPSAFSKFFTKDINAINATSHDASFILHSTTSSRNWGRSVDGGQSVLISQEDATEFYFSTQLDDQLCIMCSAPIEHGQSIATIMLKPVQKNQFSCLVITNSGQSQYVFGKHTENRLPDCALNLS